MTFVLETEKAYWSVFRYCYVICHGCQMYFLWNPLSVESLESAHFSIVSNKEGVFLLTFCLKILYSLNARIVSIELFLTLHLETILFKNGNGKKKMNEKRTSFVIHTYCIKKFSDSLRFKNHEVQSTQHIMIVFRMKILKYILYVVFSRSMIMNVLKFKYRKFSKIFKYNSNNNTQLCLKL